MFHNFEQSIPTPKEVAFNLSTVSDDDSKRKLLNEVCVVDNFDSNHFNLNGAGFIRNDISRLARAQSEEEYRMILSTLQEVKNDMSLPKGLTNEDAIRLCKPRLSQSPSELAQFADVLASYDVSKRNAKIRQEAVKAVESSPDQVDSSSAVESPS